MESSQRLRFLRPYLFGLPLANRSAYGRLFSTSRTDTKAHRKSVSCAAQQQRRNFHISSVRRDTSASSSTPDSESITRARAHKLRGDKLREYDVLKFPRLDHSPGRMTIPTFRQRFRDEASTPTSEQITLEGRVMAVRRFSKLVFLQILGGYQQVQIMVNFSDVASPSVDLDSFKRALHPLRRGDIISATGTPHRTDTGELTLRALKPPTILTPALQYLPGELINEETRILNRHVDMLVNKQTSDTIRLRAHIIKSMRDFFHDQDFLEVQTPILAGSAGGAIARPFLTTATGLGDKQLSMRIAPELWLKRLVIGGNDRVFEIGPSFRNEGLDKTHNPEFTTCEFYSAYWNMADLIRITEKLVTRLFDDADQVITKQLISLKKPIAPIPKEQWLQVEFIPSLESILGFRFPNLSLPSALDKLTALLVKHGVAIEIPGATLNKLLDHLAQKYLEDASLYQPVFITNHPACMAPLSKSFTCPKTGQLVSARAELFIQGREIANMYEEENDPFEQRLKFERQVQEKGISDEDEGVPPEIDESYVQALEYGLPPTGGWGCGVDRLVMLLSGGSRIGETLAFGSLRNVASLSKAAESHNSSHASHNSPAYFQDDPR
ncbi:hypothetical protein F5Y14DRAFT_28756 [Nemania sp. NC0429]|nr:hypothetical protein F5Y14DRAFT_28756 [Nemania sp. NC0429]